MLFVLVYYYIIYDCSDLTSYLIIVTITINITIIIIIIIIFLILIIDDNRSYERLAGLRSEVESLRRKNDSLTKEEPALSQELATSKNTLRDLRITLREVEAEVGAVDGRLQQEAVSLRKHLDDDHRHWEDKLAAATDNLRVQRARHEKAAQIAQANHMDERHRIEAKVAVLLQRKDAAITDLEVQLADLQQSAQDLEERLEELRVNKFK